MTWKEFLKHPEKPITDDELKELIKEIEGMNPFMKTQKPKLTLGDKQQHRQDIIPLTVTEVMRNDKGDLSPLAMLKLIQAKVNQCSQRFEKMFGDGYGKRNK